MPPNLRITVPRRDGCPVCNSSDLPVFAFSVDFGSVSASQEPVVWAVGYVRDPSIKYTLSGDVTTLRPYYTTQYSNATNVVRPPL